MCHEEGQKNRKNYGDRKRKRKNPSPQSLADVSRQLRTKSSSTNNICYAGC